eukprot:1954382-Rhodomonas_salina.1
MEADTTRNGSKCRHKRRLMRSETEADSKHIWKHTCDVVHRDLPLAITCQTALWCSTYPAAQYRASRRTRVGWYAHLGTCRRAELRLTTAPSVPRLLHRARTSCTLSVPGTSYRARVGHTSYQYRACRTKRA